MRNCFAPQRAAPASPAVRVARAGWLAWLALGALLGGCSSFTLEAPVFFSDPGKYIYFSCDQINATAKATANRVQELKTLMEKADQGFAGALVGTVAYRTDYISANEDLRLLDETARSKNCVTPSTWQSNSVIR
jgi:hypothetical protein